MSEKTKKTKRGSGWPILLKNVTALTSVSCPCYKTFLWGNPGLFLFIFVLYSSQIKSTLKKRICCAWDRTQGCRMVGADGSTELWLFHFYWIMVICVEVYSQNVGILWIHKIHKYEVLWNRSWSDVEYPFTNPHDGKAACVGDH